LITKLEPLHRIELIMGMPVEIDVRDADVDPAALDRAFDWLRWVDATFSTYKLDSQISRLNAGFAVDPDAQGAVKSCSVGANRDNLGLQRSKQVEGHGVVAAVLTAGGTF